MKIFDWKKREAFKTYEIPEDYVLSFTTISAIPGSRKKFQRVGRGISAGQGKTCGRGMRGQNSRKGPGVRRGFEGGQTPLYRRLPKFIGSPQKGHTKTVYNIIKMEHLNQLANGTAVNHELLLEQGIITKPNKKRKLYKVLGGVECTSGGLVVQAHAFTKTAREAIESNGGTCVVMSPTRVGVPLAQALAERAEVDAAKLVKLKALRALKAKTEAARTTSV